MEPVSFYISSAKELKTKVDAFRILFDRAPKITIYGKMIEKSSGDIAFLDSGSNVSSIIKSGLVVDVDNEKSILMFYDNNKVRVKLI